MIRKVRSSVPPPADCPAESLRISPGRRCGRIHSRLGNRVEATRPPCRDHQGRRGGCAPSRSIVPFRPLVPGTTEPAETGEPQAVGTDSELRPPRLPPYAEHLSKLSEAVCTAARRLLCWEFQPSSLEDPSSTPVRRFSDRYREQRSLFAPLSLPFCSHWDWPIPTRAKVPWNRS